MALLSREEILAALKALSEELSGENQREVIIAGGAAIVLLYNARNSTQDVDVVAFSPSDPAPIRTAALRVSDSMGLPENWLNDGAKGYLHGLRRGEIILEQPTLLVRTLAPEQLLAMKLCAWRDDVDIEDARLLLSKVPGGREAVWDMILPFLTPGDELKAQYAFEDLWEVVYGPA
jgi:hypothetical protein